MKAEIIAIGSELTCGARLDTNSRWLSRELEARGWTVQRHTTVADDRDAMIRVYQEAAKRSRVVLITGGLGPTLDDITRDTLAEAFDRKLVQDDQALAFIESLFRSRGREMPERNQVQALRPEGSESIHNPHGTAPGIFLQLQDPPCTVAVMPGVPTEMKRMFDEQVAARLPVSNVCVKRTMIRTFGFGESDVERKLGNLTARGCNPEVGITASQAVISLSITARGGSESECEHLTAEVKERIYEALGDAILGEGDVDLPDVVADLLSQQNLKIATLEGRTTGGLIGHMLTESDDHAERLIHSRQVADSELPNIGTDSRGNWEEALRLTGRRLLETGDADFVLISSPSSILEEAGVRMRKGFVMAIGDGLDRSQDVSMTGNLAIFRQRAARSALNQLRLHLRETALKTR